MAANTRPHQAAYATNGASLIELARLFARLGLVAFGGPVAHIAMMEREVVERRGWVDRQHFLDLMAVTNLLPGPNSTQMTMHVGYVQRGDRGALVAGAAFIAPAALVTLAVSWAWLTWRDLPLVDAAFTGIRPMVLAIVIAAMLTLAPRAAPDLPTRAVLLGALVLSLLDVGELAVVALGALAGLLIERGSSAWRSWFRWRSGVPAGVALVALVMVTQPWLLGAAGASGGAASGATMGPLAQLWWIFLRFGATLFGSGYLLVAYLQRTLVDGLALLTGPQLLEAIMIGEMTPGPLFTVSTAVGYLLEGVPGAVVATTAIFLPSFPLAMMLGRVMPRLSRSSTARSLVRGLGAAVVGLMLAVVWQIGRSTLIDVPSVALALAGLVIVLRTRITALALIPIGALAGVLLSQPWG
jgi:chromate transporter